jgi:hypothetical protein
MSNAEMVLFATEDGKIFIQLRAKEGSVCLTRNEIATLFQTTPQNITLHIQNIYEDKELDEFSTNKDSLLVQMEGKRSIQREIKLYNLNMILAIGYSAVLIIERSFLSYFPWINPGGSNSKDINFLKLSVSLQHLQSRLYPICL